MFLSRNSLKLKTITIGLILVLSLSIIPLFDLPAASAAEPEITLKWTGYVSGGGEALLTADVRSDIPGEEVFHAGGPVQPSSTNGTVRCLNGRTGTQVWSTSIRGIGDTATMQMADVDLDGKLEIMVALQHPSGLYILNAEDGSILWRASGQYNGFYGYFTRPSSSSLLGGRIDGSGVVGDTDGDGVPDIFIGIMAYETQPTTGAIIHLEWNGATFVERGRTQVWHPCAGGLSLGDTDNDGTPELYMNERDVYFGDGSHGRGTTGFNVWNGTHDVFDVRWTVYNWGASSNIPMLVDVNKDSVIDVVSTNLGRGIMVLNSTTGQPIKNEAGTTLKATNLAMHAHYQSSIYDIDGDGNLELLCADGKESGSFGTQVFDLGRWALDADLSAGYSFRGPSVGEVTGDGLKDIIVVTFDLENNRDIGTVQVWDGTYQKLFEYGNLRHRAIGSVVQDVDRNDDGLNELLVLTQGGRIYCFDTPGLSEESQGRPRARSEVHFFSESRLGASEYVPFERSAADITSSSPTNGQLGVSTGLASLTFNLNHPYGELMDYVVTADFSIGSASANNVGNGQKTVTINGPLSSNTTYHWQVSVTDDSGDLTVKDFSFTTGPYTPNRAPTQTTPSLAGSSEVDDLIAAPQGTSDLDGNAVTHIFNWQKDGTSIATINLPFESKTDPQDEYSGLAITKDYAYGATGNVFGATWTQNGKVGGAYSFDGTDFIRFPQPSSSSTRYDGNGGWSEMSAECWVKVTSSSTERLLVKTDLYDVTLPGEDNTTSPEISYRLDCSNSGSALSFTWRVGVGPTNIYTRVQPIYTLGPYSTTSDPSGWHHVVVTYKSGSGLRLYIDGVQVSSLLGSSYTGNVFNTDGPFEIAFGSGSDFRGIIDEVRLYPFEVSSAMVNQRYLDTKDGSSASSTISKYDTQVGEQWRCQVTPNDGLVDGTTLNTAQVTITDVTVEPLPSATNLTITPAEPKTAHDLNASYIYIPGSSGYPEYGTIVNWYKDGVFNFSNPILPAALTTRDDVWHFTVIPSNGFANGTAVTSGTVVIKNTPPIFTGGVIEPDPALNSSTLSISPTGWSDPDGDPEGYIYQWQIKTGDIYTNITGQTSKTLSSKYFNPNDTVAVRVTAFDGIDYGNTLTFETLIIDNDPPIAEPPTMISLRDDDEILCNSGVTFDPDGDNVTNIFNWLKGGGAGTSITNLYLPFETRSKITAKDYSGYNNHGSITGAVWTNGIIGGAYRFDGNDVIAVSDSASLGNDGTWDQLTVECWVNPASDQSRAVILNKNGESASANGKYMMGFMRSGSGTPSNVVYFGVYTAISAYEEPSFSQVYDNVATKIPVGSWSHVVGTYQAGFGLRLYINGVLAAEDSSVTGTIEPSIDEPLLLGYSSPVPGTSNRYFNGSLDEVKIYPKVLSAAQIFQNFVDQKDGVSNGVTLVPQETVSGDVWRCDVTPNDSWQDGNTVNASLTITPPNIKPHIDWYSPADSIIYANVSVPIDFMQTSTDPNNSPLSYSWTLNSVQQATTPNWTFTPQSTGSYTVRVTVSDGSDYDYQEWNVNVGEGIPTYSLHVEVYGGGSTNAMGDALYINGSAVEVLATANPDCSFVGWLLNGTDVGSTNPYSLTMDANYNLTAVFTQPPTPQYQLTVQISGQGTTNPTGTSVYESGTQVSVMATADEGWDFSHWLLNGPNVGSNNPYILTMNANYNLTAVFYEETDVFDDFETGNLSKWDGQDGNTNVITTNPYSGTYHMRNTLSSAANNGWAGVYKNISGNSTVILGAQVQFNQPPDTNDEDQWVLAFTQTTAGNALAYAGIRQVDGVDYWAIWYLSSGTTLTYQVSNVPYTGGYHHLQLTIKRGTANDGSIEFKVDGQLVCQATNIDNDGRALNYARVGFSYSDAASAASSTVDLDNVELSFESPPPVTVYYLTTNVDGNGLITKTPDQATYVSGSTVQLTAVPQPGWTFTGWSGDLTGTANPTTITIDANKSVTAHFEPETYVLTVNVIGQGSVARNPNQASYAYGINVELTADAVDGWVFSGWSGDLTGTTSSASITMNSNKTVTATFTEIIGPEPTETFESGGLSYWTGQDGTAAISTVYPYRGVYHLSCGLSSGANNGWSGVYKSIAGTNPAYLSAYVRFNAPPDTNAEDQWVLAFTQTTAGNALAYGGVRNVGGTLYWSIWYLSAGSTLAYQVSTTEYTPGWHNLELALYRGTSNDGWVQLTVDGAVVCYADNLDNDGRTLNYARVGFSYSDAPASTSTTVYIDDITIDTSPPTLPPTYTINLQSQQDTLATSNLGTINCQGTNYALPGTSVEEAGVCSVAYNAADGYLFSHWECTGAITVSNANSASTTINIAGNGSLKAIYKVNVPPPEYSLTININGEGSVSKIPNQSTYPSGSVVTLNATPLAGYMFAGWSGDYIGSANPTSITMTGDMTITATFAPISSQAYWFIDGFEEPLPGNWSGTDGNASNSTDNVHQGTYSLRCALASGANNGWSGAYKSLLGLSGANPVALGAYVSLSAPPNTDNEDQWVLAFTQTTAGNALAYAGVRQVNGQLYWATWYYSGTSLVYQVSSTEYTEGWHHLELSIYRGTANNGTLEFKVDGTTVCQAQNLDNDGRTLGYARVGFSYSDAPSSASTTVYIDDVTIE